MLWLLISMAILPALAIIVMVYRSDRYDNEPIPLLFLAFVFGLISTVIAAILETGYQAIFPNTDEVLNVLMNAMIGVGLMEELSKWIFLRYYLFRRRAFNEPLDGIIYGVMISMGFATLENIMYVLQGGLQVALLRAFTAVPAHAAFGVVMGYFVGIAKFSFGNRKKNMLLSGLIYAALLHGLYDFFLLQQENHYLIILSAFVLILSVVLSIKAIRKQRKNSPYGTRLTEDDRFSPGGNEPDL